MTSGSYKRTQKHRVAISDSLKGRKPKNFNCFQVAGWSRTRSICRSEKHKHSISEANKGKHLSIETKRKIGAANKVILIGKKLSNETKKKISLSNMGRVVTTETRNKIAMKNLGKRRTAEVKLKLKESRKYTISPVIDTSIEIKIQNYLKFLNIEFYTHQYMNIEHGYQCDISIPIQLGITQKTIIECDGDYWHGNSNIERFKILNSKQLKMKEIDFYRTQELIAQGYRVIRLWESDIRKITDEEFKQKIMEIKNG